MTGAAEALRRALADFWRQSWRLALLNAALSAAVLTVAVAAAFSPAALVLAVLLGPLAAALMHCAVVLARTEELRLACAVDGLRLHWRRGLELGALTAVVLASGAYAALFYARAQAAGRLLTFVVAYLLACFCVLQLHLWPIAVLERERRLRDVLRIAVVALLRRPGASVGLALALLLVNAAGLAAAVMPFLTLTIAYSFLAAAHFALPRPSTEA